MKTHTLGVYVAIVASVVTLITMMFQNGHRRDEGRRDEGFAGLPQQFTPQEEAKLKVLRNKKLFVADGKSIQVNLPIWVERELRVTNADETNGAIRLQRTDGKTGQLGVAKDFQADVGLFPKDRQSYFMIPDARDLLIQNGDGKTHRIQSYTTGFNPDTEDTYLEGYPTDPSTGDTHATQYKQKPDALRECTRINATGGKCGGITKNAQTQMYTLRVGNLKQSSHGEISTTRR